MFSYLPDEDRIEFSESFSPVLENDLIISDATSLFRGSDLIHENDRDDFFALLNRCRKEDGWVKNAIRFYVSEGRYEWLEVHLHAETEASHNNPVISGTLVNMAGWKNEVNLWKEKANRDALTGLFNREYFELSSSNSLEKDSLASAAIVFIDIDDFKHVNDTLGHMFGDDILCCVAKRVLGVFRHTDVVARYGGDEFVVFVSGINRPELEKRLKQLCEVFRFPYRNETVSYQISGSIGAAMFPDDGTNYEELLDHADCALYAAKERGKDQYAMYAPHMDGASSRKN
jgi:putative two-component system response regulator